MSRDPPPSLPVIVFYESEVPVSSSKTPKKQRCFAMADFGVRLVAVEHSFLSLLVRRRYVVTWVDVLLT